MKHLVILMATIICLSGCTLESDTVVEEEATTIEDVEIIYDEDGNFADLVNVDEILREYTDITGKSVDEPVRSNEYLDALPKEKIAAGFIDIGYKLYSAYDFIIYISYVEEKQYYHVEIFKGNELGGGMQYLVDGLTGEIFWGWGTE